MLTIHDHYMRISIEREIPFFRRHEDMALICILQGTAQVKLNNRSCILHTDDIFVIRNDLYRILDLDEEGKTQLYFLLLRIDLRYFDRYLPRVSEVMIRCGPDTDIPQKERVLSAMRRSLARIVESRENREEAAAHIVDLLKILGDNYNYIVKNVHEYKSEENYGTIWNIYRYMYNHYKEKIMLEDIANHIHVSAAYLPHLLKVNTGKTFQELLGYVRAERSLDLLVKTDKSLTEISDQVGFSHPRYYNKYFQMNFGCNPGEFRRENKMAARGWDADGDGWSEEGRPVWRTEEEKALLKRKMDAYLNGRTQKSQGKENSVRKTCVSAEMPGSKEPFAHHWSETIEVGQFCNLSNVGFKNLLNDIQKEMNFRYGRIYDCFSEYFHYKKTAEEEKELYWNAVYRGMAILHQNRLRPEIVVNEAELESKLFAANMQRLLRAGVQKYGMEEIKKWRFRFQTGEASPSSLEKEGGAVARLVQSLGCGIVYEYGMDEKDKVEWLDPSFIPVYFVRTALEGPASPDFFNRHNLLCNPGEGLFDGNSALTTYNGLRKPLYYAYYMLNKLGDKVVQKDKGYIITCRDYCTEIQILIYHYPGERERETPVGREAKRILLELSGLTPGNYLLRRYSFGKEECSMSRVLSFEAANEIKYEDVVYLNQSCCPKLSLDFIHVETAFKTDVEISFNSMLLILLEKVETQTL